MAIPNEVKSVMCIEVHVLGSLSWRMSYRKMLLSLKGASLGVKMMVSPWYLMGFEGSATA